MPHRCCRADVLYLRIGEHLVHRVDRAARHTRLVQHLDPFGGSTVGKNPLDLLAKQLAVLRAAGVLLELLALDPFFLVHRLGKALPDRVTRGGDVHIAVFRLVGRGGHAHRVVVARLPGYIARHQVTRRLEIEQRDLRVQQVRLHPLAFARYLALEQRGHDAERRHQAGGHVRHRRAGAHRPLPGKAGHRHEAAHALRDLVEARPGGVGSVLAETGHAREDDPLVDLLQRLVVHAEAELHVGAVVLHHHVGLLHQLPEYR